MADEITQDNADNADESTEEIFKPSKKKTTKKTSTKKKTSTPTPTPKKTLVLVNKDGTESPERYEIEQETKSTIFIKKVEPDHRNILIEGVSTQVDLNALKKMSPSATYLGKRVELLIAAAELA